MATFSSLRAVDFHKRVEEHGIIQLEPLQDFATHPFAPDADRCLLLPSDFYPHGAQVKLNTSTANAMYERCRRMEKYILACANGMTIEEIISNNGVVPPSIPPAVIHQLQLGPPPLFDDGVVNPESLCLPGTEEHLRTTYRLCQKVLHGMTAYILAANERKAELSRLGIPCLWVHERQFDVTYRDSDVTLIPALNVHEVTDAIRILLLGVQIKALSIRASLTTVDPRSHLFQFVGGTVPILVNPEHVVNLPIAYSASQSDTAMLLLPSSSAPSVRVLHSLLLPQAPEQELPDAPDAFIVLSDADDEQDLDYLF